MATVMNITINSTHKAGVASYIVDYKAVLFCNHVVYA